MPAISAIHSFQRGMVKDLDKSLVTKEQYLDAHNYRLVTSAGESTGALENVEGNNNIYPTVAPGDTLVVGDVHLVVKGTATYNSVAYTLGQTFTVVGGFTTFSGAGSLTINTNTIMPTNMYVAGSVYVRDTIVLFLTNNTGAVPTGGRSMVVKMTLTASTEVISTISVLYDDSLNNTTGYLLFSTANPIRSVGSYESATIQKIYWCDGFNNVRYANIASYLTTDGLVKSGGNFYFSPDLFEFIPEITLTKPTLEYLSPGSVKAGTVQYAFQYFNNHGAESMMSPLSNTIHITLDDDFATSNANYKGEPNSLATTGKSVRMLFSIPESDKFNNIRIIRLHYETINSIPTITVVGETVISSAISTISFLDNGENSLGVLTLDEFNLGETELFSAKDLAVKNERLFAANIHMDEFTLGTWDSRAVRFRHWHEPSTASDDWAGNFEDGVGGCTIVYADVDQIEVTISDIDAVIGTTVTGVTGVINISGGVDLQVIGTYDLGSAFSSNHPAADVLSFDASALPILSFVIQNDSAWFPGASVLDPGTLVFDINITYEYTSYINHEDAVVHDGASHIHIDKPASDSTADWNTAGWTNYTTTHDGINVFNDPANDGVAEHAFIYQRDCATLGAEGLNIKIGFATDSMIIDKGEAANPLVYNVQTESTSDNLSYTNFASPFMSGRRSWQRDEVYRLYIVFFDAHGRSSSAKWVCDLRMPSLHDSGYEVLADISGADIITKALYPTVTIKSFPTGAVSAQLLRVERGGADRSVLTQALVVPVGDAAIREPLVITSALHTHSIIKLVSPEINITNNVSLGSSDYLEYVTNFTAITGTGAPIYVDINAYKLTESNLVAFAANCKSPVDDLIHKGPLPEASTFVFSGNTCINYNTTTDSYGCSGLFVHHTNAAAWTANGVDYVVANYKRNVYNSQYGGNTYESRDNNIAIPASGLITATATSYTAWNGDTFINFFDVSTLLFDLTKTTGNSENETVYVPLESSINCDLRHDTPIHSSWIVTPNLQLMQETSGTWTNGSGTVHSQASSLYQYNTVYSQDSTAKFYVNIPSSVSTDVDFDCMVKVSKVKINGESQDSWTLFPVNDFIEVNTKFGPITTLASINEKLLFWQDNAFGVLSVNDRSLIQDSGGASLVLGTGGVLDRYDYISNSVGATSNMHVMSSQTGVYWINTKDKSVYRFTSTLENISKSKLIQSWFEVQLAPLVLSYNIIRMVYDKRYNHVLMSFYNTNTAAGTTLVFDENIDTFSGFYDYYTPLFIPYTESFLSVGRANNVDYIFYHNSLLKERCCFYSSYPAVAGADATTSKYFDSTVKVLFNDNFSYTKVFDNLSFVTSASNTTSEALSPLPKEVELYNNTFSSIRCYNNYQNSDYCTLTYGKNPAAGALPLQRDEREWTTHVPRNAVNKAYSTSPNVFATANIDKTRTFKERIRDKYMITDFKYTNTLNRRFTVPYITVKYRISPR